MFKKIVLSLIFASMPVSLYAAECRWIETAGEAAIEGITAEEARNLALNRARSKAVEEVCGINIQGSTLVKDFAVVTDFIKAMSAGYVLEDKVIGWESSVYQEKPDLPPVMLYRVKLNSCVAQSGPGDPYFKVSAEMNRLVFQSGDEARIKAKCTKDCYLTIANITSEGKIRILLPNGYQTPVRLKTGEEYSFPPEGIALEMSTSPGCERDTEAMLVIATKEKAGAFDAFRGGTEITPKDFYNAVLSLPSEERAEEILVYEIRQ